VTDAPIALTVHNGHSAIPEEQQRLIGQWLAANRINPDQVSAGHPITVLTVPHQPPTYDGTQWLLQIIVFHQFYVGPDGAREIDFLTRQPVCFQRTVPLTVAYPTPSAAEETPADATGAQPTGEPEGQEPPGEQEPQPAATDQPDQETAGTP
jgi:hypothetical protein